ncbi:MAG TPA: hypothetical protein VJ979_11515 [Actinomycetota bacterium]|nr:hypothetical protein [Actinomycetota bacterium]
MIQGRKVQTLAGAGLAFVLVATLAVSGLTAFAVGQDERAGGGSAVAGHEHEHERTAFAKRAFRDDMRKLWEDHITWTRLVIVSFAADLPDLGPTTERLLQNQVDIGDAFTPFYGKAAAHRLTALLTEHITVAVDVLVAAKAGDDDAFQDASDVWYRNGRQIARFLHEANPDNWGLREMRRMMREHLDLTLAEAAHRLAGEFEKDIAAYDAVHGAILHMADMLSRGVIKQFPGKFA